MKESNEEIETISQNWPYLVLLKYDSTIQLIMVVERNPTPFQLTGFRVIKALIGAYFTFNIEYQRALTNFFLFALLCVTMVMTYFLENPHSRIRQQLAIFNVYVVGRSAFVILFFYDSNSRSFDYCTSFTASNSDNSVSTVPTWSNL